MASHITQESFGLQRSWWSTYSLQGSQLISHHHRAWQLVWGVCADMLVFTKRYFALQPNHFSLVSSVQRTLFLKSWGSFRWNFANWSHAAMFCSSPGNTSQQVAFIQPLSHRTVMTLKLLPEACRVKDLCFVFIIIQMILKLFWALHGLALAWIGWSIISWEGWQLSWIFLLICEYLCSL